MQEMKTWENMKTGERRGHVVRPGEDWKEIAEPGEVKSLAETFGEALGSIFDLIERIFDLPLWPIIFVCGAFYIIWHFVIKYW